MRRLLLLRHAKSDWPPGVADDRRPLAPRGLRTAPRLGAYLAEEALRPDRVLVSMALRAQQTWHLVHDAWPDLPEGETTDGLYGHSTDEIIGLVRSTPASVRSLLLVGHNPEFETLVERLAGRWSEPARRRLDRKFPTAGLAVIDLPVDDWSEVSDGIGRLDRFITPASLDNPAADTRRAGEA